MTNNIELLRGLVADLRDLAEQARVAYSGQHASGTFRDVVKKADKLDAALAAMGGEGEGCHCATCTCAPGMTPAIRFDASPAEREGAVRDQLIAMGWKPPQQPEAQAGGKVVYGVDYGPDGDTVVEAIKCECGRIHITSVRDTPPPGDATLRAEIARLEKFRDLTYSGNDVYLALSEQAKRRTSPDNVADTLDALNRAAKGERHEP